MCSSNNNETNLFRIACKYIGTQKPNHTSTLNRIKEHYRKAVHMQFVVIQLYSFNQI